MNSIEIDFASRRKAAGIYRRFAAGLLTNDRMEGFLPKSSEPGLEDIFFCGIWPLYNDLHEHKLTGPYRLTPMGRDHVARIVIFLHTSFPYRWPLGIGRCNLTDLLAAVLTFDLYRRTRTMLQTPGGDESVWPFFTRTEYETALRHPPFLHRDDGILF